MSEKISAGGLEFFLENRGGRADGDGGPSLQVLGQVDGAKVQLLRFDMFRLAPHYHYAPDGVNLRYDLDPLALDDGIAWALGLIARKLPQLLAKAGYEELGTPAAVSGVSQALPEIERRWRAQR
jgi:hypothetical protein